MTKRFLGHFLLLLVVLFVLKKSLDFTFGWVLAEVFARGTNCETSLANPRLHLFPLSATVDDVMIRHRSEPASAGFRSKRISIRLNFTNLFHRELLLSDLELLGANAQSDGTDTGFIQTFAFLFPPKDPNAPPPPQPSAFARWLKGWVFHITTIRITTEDKPNQLVIRFHGNTYRWNKVDVNFVEEESDPKKPYEVTAEASNFRLQGGDVAEIPLGTLKGYGEIGLGQLHLVRASVGSGDQNSETSEVRAEGRILLPAPGKYEISLQSTLHRDYLQNALGRFIAREQNVPEQVHLTGELKGSYLRPELSGAVEVQFPPGALLRGREECGIRDMQAHYALSSDGMRFYNLAAEDIIKQGEVTLTFAGAQEIRGSLELALDREKRWMQNCFLSGVAAESSTLQQAAADSLADSQTSISVSGTLNPFELTGNIRSDLSMKTQAMQSKLVSDFHVTDSELKLTLQERGVVPQIQPDNIPSTPTEEGGKTSFHRAVNSNIDVDLRYGFDTQLLQVERLNILRYPTERILARVGPFLGDALYRALLLIPSPESLLNVDVKGTTNFHDRAELTGAVSCTNLVPYGVPVDRIGFDLTANGQELNVKDVAADILGGNVRASLRYVLGSQSIAAKLSAADIHFDNLPAWHSALPFLQASLDGAMGFEGSLPQLSYSGGFDITTSQKSKPDTTRKSRLEISGTSAELKAAATVLSPANRIDVVLPFSGDEKALFETNVELGDFPLDYLFPESAEEEMEEPSERAKGGLTGSLHYRGPYKTPLLGEGSVQISRLWLSSKGLSLEQAAPLEASIHGGKLIFTNVRLLSAGRELALKGSVDHTTGWDAQLSGRWELSTFLRRVEMLEQTSGEVQLDLRIKGPPGEPSLSGPVRLRDGSISFPLGKTIVGVNELAADGEFSQHDLVFQKIDGRVGGAKVTGAASFKNIAGGGKLELWSEFSFRHVTVEPIEHLTFELDGDIGVHSAEDPPFVLGGEIELRSGQYENIIKLTQVLQAITRTIVGSESAAPVRRVGQHETSPANLGFDLHLNAPGGFLLDTNVAQAELRGDLHLIGTLEQPLLDGKIEALEGVFGLGAQEFEILTGEAAFFARTNSLDPRISLVGETKVLSRSGEEHQVRLNVSGTLTNPRIAFASDSGLRRDEIQSLVGLGANFEALDFLHGGKHTRSFAELINPASNVTIEERLRGLTKFETVRIDTSLSPATGEFVPRVVAKRPVARRLDLDIQSELGGRRSSSAELEYELTPYLSLIGGWRSGSLRRDIDQSSGSLEGGIHYRSSFPGFHLFSPSFTGAVESNAAGAADSAKDAEVTK